ncbi:MAG: type II toxin-antitoxin system VapC family toxin [bacterium]|nr:type II toxin-antitoxin system VapC family toxin [bacterium]
MKALLDTHVFLWAASAPEHLAAPALRAIEDRSNDIFVSAAAAWEISIKTALGKLVIPGDPATWFPSRVRSLGFDVLAIDALHALATRALPRIHADPFDRIMIAQAQLEGLTFITRDPMNLQYPVALLEA